MPKVTDLTGETIVGFLVIGRAAEVNRARYWNVEHVGDGPGTVGCDNQPRVISHEQLMTLRAGRDQPPRCYGCNPTDDAVVDQGMHVDPPAAVHPVGTPCAAPSELQPQNEGAGRGDLYEPTIVWQGAAVARTYQTATGPEVPILPPAEPVVRAGTGDAPARVAVFGRAEGIDEAQRHLAVLRQACTQEKRAPSRQLPGMSSLGTPCDRKLARLILEGKEDPGPAWRPFMGTAGHAALEPVFGRQLDSNRAVEYLVNLALEAGGSRGYIDQYHVPTRTLVDTKFAGVTKLRGYYRGQVPEVYQGQLDLYALGLTIAGYPVERVAVLAPPMAGEVDETAWYSRAVDLGHAHRLIARGWEIRARATAGDPLASFALSEDNCAYCPLFRRGDCAGEGKTAARVAAPPPITWGG